MILTYLVQNLKKLLSENPELIVEVCEELLKVEHDEVSRTVLEYLRSIAKARILSKHLQA